MSIVKSEEIMPYVLLFPKAAKVDPNDIEKLIADAKDSSGWAAGVSHSLGGYFCKDYSMVTVESDTHLSRPLKQAIQKYLYKYNLSDMLKDNLQIEGASLRQYFPKTFLGPHGDWDEKDSSSKNWTITANIYLNDNYSGGEICFWKPPYTTHEQNPVHNSTILPETSYKPSKGDILIFPSAIMHAVNVVDKFRYGINVTLIQDSQPTWYLDRFNR